MLNYEIDGGVLTVHLQSELDHSSASRLRGELDKLIADKRIRHLVFDLSRLEFMDSSGIGLVIGRYRQMTRRGGRVSVKNADKRIDRLFQMSGVYKLVDRMA